MKVLVRSPSNIAIVKYMGKRPADASGEFRNIPENPSLSMTLSSLCTFVELKILAAPVNTKPSDLASVIVSEVPAGARGETPRLSDAGREKYLKHLARCELRLPALLERFGISAKPDFGGRCEIRTSNTFPQAAGIASSASSFSGLTLAATVALTQDAAAFRTTWKSNSNLRVALAELSREGSGSSCRSFDGPFVAWEGESVKKVVSNLPPLSDLVIVVSSGEKKVGSSEAHALVKTSPNWPGRVKRAGERFKSVKNAIESGDWKTVTETAEAEFRDMHGLFETSEPAFSYFDAGTEKVLDYLEAEHGDAAPAITLDAGPNIHVLVPQFEEAYWKKLFTARFPEYPILVDREGAGAEILEVTP